MLTVTAADAAENGRRAETVGRYVLSDPETRRLARRWVLGRGAVGLGAGRALRDRLDAAGTTQRLLYEEEELDRGSFAVEGRLLVALGLASEDTVLRRRLVDARVLGRGPGGRRLDCLPADATP